MLQSTLICMYVRCEGICACACVCVCACLCVHMFTEWEGLRVLVDVYSFVRVHLHLGVCEGVNFNVHVYQVGADCSGGHDWVSKDLRQVSPPHDTPSFKKLSGQYMILQLQCTVQVFSRCLTGNIVLQSACLFLWTIQLTALKLAFFLLQSNLRTWQSNNIHKTPKPPNQLLAVQLNNILFGVYWQNIPSVP